MSAPGPAERDRPLRRVTSFVRRGTRLTPNRQASWDAHAADYLLQVPHDGTETGVDPAARLDPTAVFGRTAPLIVEIGTGLGETIAADSAAHPEADHLGFEVYRPGIAQTLIHLERAGLPRNARLVEADAESALVTLLPAGSIAETWIFFPDPWHKTRHHKRRLVSARFAGVLARSMTHGGMLRIATDWEDYATHALEQMSAADGWERVPTERFDRRPTTSFEKKARAAGRTITDLAYRWTGTHRG